MGRVPIPLARPRPEPEQNPPQSVSGIFPFDELTPFYTVGKKEPTSYYHKPTGQWYPSICALQSQDVFLNPLRAILIDGMMSPPDPRSPQDAGCVGYEEL